MDCDILPKSHLGIQIFESIHMNYMSLTNMVIDIIDNGFLLQVS